MFPIRIGTQHSLDDGLVAQFWYDVRKELIDHHHVKPPVADAGIERYRSDADRFGFAGAVYNHGPDQAADAIAGWLGQEKWPEPPRS